MIIFNEDLIDLDINTVLPNETIMKAGQLLVKNGLCNEEYVNAMLNTYSEFGGYIVLDDEFAMPHARPEFGAIKTGFSILRLNKPVDFKNDDFLPVRVVMAIVSNTNEEHLKLMQLVSDLIENGFIKMVINAQNKNEIISFINNLMED